MYSRPGFDFLYKNALLPSLLYCGFYDEGAASFEVLLVLAQPS